jgi:hypothetical protein
VSNAQQNTGRATWCKAIELVCARIVTANLSLDVSRSFATLTCPLVETRWPLSPAWSTQK